MHPEIVRSLFITNHADGGHANAASIVVDGRPHIVTAGHVGNVLTNFSNPETGEVIENRFPDRRGIDRIDVISTSLASGLEQADTVTVGETVFVMGYHTDYNGVYVIQARVLSDEEMRAKIPPTSMLLARGRIVVKTGDGDIFKPGMSGSVAVNGEGKVVGMLTSSPGDDPRIAALEPLLQRKYLLQ